MSYWTDRQEKANKAIADKTIKDIEKQLKKYYKNAMERTIADFEETYNKLIDTVADGKEPTPADLYKLDQYWQMQGQLKNEMQKLGDKEIAIMSKEFEDEWIDIYKGIHLPSDNAFSTISTVNAKQMINSSWLADGKTFSQRVWGNTEKLVDTLNEQLIHCVVTGKKPTELRKLLQERFNVSYNQANTLVKTEVAHIETASAAQRYKDYGLEKYEFLGRDEHDIGCACKKLDGKQFFYSEMVTGKNAPPLHPNCRCTIIPVIDDDELIMEDKEMDKKEKCPKCGKAFVPKDGYLVCDECKEELLHDKYGIWATKQGYKKKDIVNSYVDEKVFDNMEYVSLYKKYVENQNWYNAEDEVAELWKLEKIEQQYDKDVYFFACIDCGEVFIKNNPKSNNQNRCPDCQKEYRKKYKAQKERERRARKKNN